MSLTERQIYDLTGTITTWILLPAHKDLEKRVVKLLDRHAEKSSTLSSMVIHDGMELTTASPDMQRYFRRWAPRLHPDLKAEGDAITAEHRALDRDKVLLRQILTVLLAPCKDLQDVRDALPNSLRESVEEAKLLPRTREEAYTILGNPQAVGQYRRLRDVIELNNTIRLCA